MEGLFGLVWKIFLLWLVLGFFGSLKRRGQQGRRYPGPVAGAPPTLRPLTDAAEEPELVEEPAAPAERGARLPVPEWPAPAQSPAPAPAAAPAPAMVFAAPQPAAQGPGSPRLADRALLRSELRTDRGLAAAAKRAPAGRTAAMIQRLRRQGSLADAVVMAEVLGRPRAQRPHSLWGRRTV